MKAIIVGSGFMGDMHACCYKNIGVDIVAVVDVSEDMRTTFMNKYACRGFSSLEQALKEVGDSVDIVDICTPSFLHKELVMLSAENKKHIMCEKPLALSSEDAKEMIKKCEDNDAILMTGHVLRFWHEYVKMKQWVDEGIFGDIKFVSATRISEHPKSEWISQSSKSGGGIYEFHIHDVDILLHIFGDVQDIYASGKKSENGCWNYSNSIINFKSGVNAIAQEIFGVTEGYPFSMNFIIVGSASTAEFSFKAGVNLEDLSSAKNTLTLYRNAMPAYKEECSSEDAYQTEIKYFVDCIKYGKKNSIVSTDSVIKTIEAIEAIKKSLETNSVIKIN